MESDAAILERIKRDGRYSVPRSGGIPLTYQQREALKQEAWAVLRSTDENIYLRGMAFLHLTEAHYWRAKESLEARPKRQQRRIYGELYCGKWSALYIDVYTRHWLWANGDRISEDVVQFVNDKFGYFPEKSPFLPKGKSIYVLPSEKEK